MMHVKDNKEVGEKKCSKLDVCQPPMLPFLKMPGVRALNRTMVIKEVRRWLCQFGVKDFVFVTTVPNACDFIGILGESKIVYYSVDDFTEWPGLDKHLVQQMETDLIAKSDIFIASSNKLLNRLSKSSKPAHLLSHGVDLELFQTDPLVEHPLLKNIPEPRVGYFGLFDKRSDQNLIADVAQRMPDISFVITGPIEVSISYLKNFPNIYFTGSVPYNDLPEMVKGWDICFLPYLVNKQTAAISPLKLKEYLATGKPVISTPIAEANELKDYITVAESAVEWEKCFRICLYDCLQTRHAKNEQFLKNESWTKKADQFLKICL
jgi:glycosyltransferase involved in cell wall biosynthesis